MISLSSIAKSIISESPDEVRGVNNAYWYSEGANAFIYDPESGVYLESYRSTHDKITRVLMMTNERIIKKSEMYKYIEFDPKDQKIVAHWSDNPTVVDYFNVNEKQLLKYISEKSENYARKDSRKDYGIAGRYWKTNKVISLWIGRTEGMKLVHDGTIKKIIDLTGLKSEEVRIDFFDDDDPPEYYVDIVRHAKRGDEKVSKKDTELLKKLMAKQHLDPNAKKDLASDEYRDLHHSKQAQGHEFAALANARKSTSDGIEKDDDELIKEDPDMVDALDIEYGFNDAVTFAYNKKFDVFFYADTNMDNDVFTHGNIFGILGGMNGPSEKHFGNYFLGQNKTRITKNGKIIGENGDEVMRYKGSFDNAIKFSKVVSKVTQSDRDDYEPRTLFGPSGRYWKDHNVISFWMTEKKAMKLVNDGTIEHIIKLSGFNDPEEVQVDFADLFDTLPPTLKTLSTSRKKGGKELSPEEEKELMSKQHLDPAAKAKLAGDDFKLKHLKKLAQGHDFAAQANAKKNTSDGIIRLKDLLP